MVSVLLVLSIMIFAAGVVAWAVRMIETWRAEAHRDAHRRRSVLDPAPQDNAQTPETCP